MLVFFMLCTTHFASSISLPYKLESGETFDAVYSYQNVGELGFDPNQNKLHL